MICLGSQMRNCDIRNAFNIVHYSLPSSFNDFGLRHLRAMDSLRSNQPYQCSSIILLGENEMSNSFVRQELPNFTSHHGYSDMEDNEKVSFDTNCLSKRQNPLYTLNF